MEDDKHTAALSTGVVEPTTSQKEAKEEALRLLRLALAVGIPSEMVRLTKPQVAGCVDTAFQIQNGASGSLDHIYDKKWLKTGEFLVIEAGGRWSRLAVAYHALFQSVLTFSGDVNSPIAISACDLLLRFNSYDKARYDLMESLRESACLYLSEVDCDMYPNPQKDAPLLLEGLFSYRLQHHLPTIFSITDDFKKFSWTGWGQSIQGTMLQGIKRWPKPNTSFYRIRIQEGPAEGDE